MILREIFDEIERRAEANMMRTHKLEGMHYAALKDVRKELGAERSNSVLCKPGCLDIPDISGINPGS